MKPFLSLLLFALFSISVNAQIIEGEIIIDEYSGGSVAIEIINLNTQQKMVSTDFHFQITAQKEDVLLFRSAVTRDRKLKVTDEIIQKSFNTIHLNREIIQLKDTKAIALSGYLEEDIETVPEDKFKDIKGSVKYTFSDLELMNLKRDLGIKPINGEIGTQIDLMAIATFMAKKIFKQKPMPKSVSNKTNEEIIAYLGISYFQEELGIQPFEIDDFLTMVALHYADFRRKNYLDILLILENQAVQYKKSEIL